jgi:transcription elongation factor GreA
MVDGVTILTPTGLVKLNEELRVLKVVRRREVANKIEHAKELGDLRENAEYSEAKDEQAFIEGRILELEALLNSATVVERTGGKDRVGIGSSVSVRIGERERSFEIVGANEADPTDGKISNESPLGRALLGRSIGDDVEIQAPKGEITYTIIGIS